VGGFVVHPGGRVEQLPEDTMLTPVGAWRRARGKVEYPVRWALNLGGRELEVSPVVDDQLHAFRPPMWSGMVVARGTSGSAPLSAVGTLQLQGYGDE
jgi:predicted secreted hydrolase